MNKIQKNDKVLVIAGKYRGKTGKVLSVFPKIHKVIVENVNTIIKHTRPKKQGEKGQRIQTLAPIHWSNVKIICPNCGKAVRTKFEIIKNGKVRICVKCNKAI